jgi:hypothetical protein
MAETGYYALLLGGLGGFFWWRHRFERALSARRRERALAAKSVIDRPGAVDQLVAVLVPNGAVGFSKMGGVPDLPEELSPPAGREGGSRFVGQIEFAAARSAGIDWLPSSGAIYVFCDQALHDAPDFAQVVYGPVGGTTFGDGTTARSRETRLSLLPVRSFPSSLWLGIRDGFQGALERIDTCAPLARPSPHHQLGGYPDEIQHERLSRTSAKAARAAWSLPEEPESWRLLLQIDSDPKLGLEFGDGGRLFILVRTADAKACDFSRTVSIWQSY